MTATPRADGSFPPARDAVSPVRARHECDTIPVFARWLGSWRLSLHRRAFDAAELARRYDRAAAGWSRTLGRLDFPVAYAALARSLVDVHALDRKPAPSGT